MDGRDLESAVRARARIEGEKHEPSWFCDALLRVPPTARDAWVDIALGLGEIPDDGPELPRDCVPYLPCSVDALLRVVEQAPVRASDVFVDVGSGVGRAAALVHLLTGASAVGIEVQPHLARAARDLAARLRLSRLTLVEGDAASVLGDRCLHPEARGVNVALAGSVFFLYCPFSGDRLAKILTALEGVARTRAIRVCCLDLPLPPRPSLELDPPCSADLAIYRSAAQKEATRMAGRMAGDARTGPASPRSP